MSFPLADSEFIKASLQSRNHPLRSFEILFTTRTATFFSQDLTLSGLESKNVGSPPPFPDNDHFTSYIMLSLSEVAS